MATNVPAHRPDVVCYAITGAAETSVVIPEPTIRYLKLQCTTAADFYIGFSPGATWSADNRWTVKSDDSLELRDIAMKPRGAGGIFLYARGSGSVTIEVFYMVG